MSDGDNAEMRKHLEDFLAYTKKDDSYITGTVLATMAQFLMRTRIAVNQEGIKNGFVTKQRLLEIQIEQLRDCIIDLQGILNRPPKELIQ